MADFGIARVLTFAHSQDYPLRSAGIRILSALVHHEGSRHAIIDHRGIKVLLALSKVPELDIQICATKVCVYAWTCLPAYM